MDAPSRRARPWRPTGLPGIVDVVTGRGSGPSAEAALGEPFDGQEVLAALAALEISTWSYEWEPTVRHLGPMSQDFMAAFGLGADDRKIDLLDANGVNMVAIQALLRRLQTLEAEVAALRGRSDRSG